MVERHDRDCRVPDAHQAGRLAAAHDIRGDERKAAHERRRVGRLYPAGEGSSDPFSAAEKFREFSGAATPAPKIWTDAYLAAAAAANEAPLVSFDRGMERYPMELLVLE